MHCLTAARLFTSFRICFSSQTINSEYFLFSSNTLQELAAGACCLQGLLEVSRRASLSAAPLPARDQAGCSGVSPQSLRQGARTARGAWGPLARRSLLRAVTRLAERFSRSVHPRLPPLRKAGQMAHTPPPPSPSLIARSCAGLTVQKDIGRRAVAARD